MIYGDFSFKKMKTMSMIVCMVIFATIASIFLWTAYIGDFSASNVKNVLTTAETVWQYRIEFAAEFGPKTASATSLLADAGLFAPNTLNTISTSTAASIPVLLYHGIVPTSTGPDETSINAFKDQMFALKNAGWQTVTIEQFVAAMKGEEKLPPKSFLLTFDDGRQDTYENGTPILKALGYQAVMYVITGHSLVPGNEKSKYYVTDTQLHDMLQSGVWEVQSHSDIGHDQYPIDAWGDKGDFYGSELWIPTQDPGESDANYQNRIATDLTDYFVQGKSWTLLPGRLETTQEYQNRVATDLQNAKDMIEQKLGVNVLSFAYPYNDFAKDLSVDNQNGSSYIVNEVNSIYPVSFYQWYPSLGFSENYPSQDGQLLKRIEPRADWTAQTLLATLDAGQAKALPYQLSNDTGKDWTSVWGTVSEKDNILNLTATSTSSGAETILDGSRLWQNYDVEATVDWTHADSFSVFARYQATPLETRYLDCNFGTNSISLEDRQNNVTTIIDKTQSPLIVHGTHDILSFKLSGNYAECVWNGEVTAEGYIDQNAPATGGIGLEAWSPTIGVTAAHIKDLTVTTSQ